MDPHEVVASGALRRVPELLFFRDRIFQRCWVILYRLTLGLLFGVSGALFTLVFFGDKAPQTYMQTENVGQRIFLSTFVGKTAKALLFHSDPAEK